MTKYALRPEQVAPSWATLKIEVIFAPKTGALRPWEMYGVFTFPSPRRVFWGSYKTEATALKARAKLIIKYPQAI